jgi:transglutaminase-like putative cysteine protease
MYYSIRHITQFHYSETISESLMEVRMQPRSEGHQHCLSFDLIVSPKARANPYMDYLGNTLHTFDIPRHHTYLTITAQALVEVTSFAPLPDLAGSWDELDKMTSAGDYWDLMMPSLLVQPTSLLHQLADELKVVRRDDPLTVLRDLNSALYYTFQYKPQSTRVDSPLDDALESRAGVCQDFAHIMIALVRGLGIPCRYVSGYLYHQHDREDRSQQDATHAWVEIKLPQLGWLGFDPTNNLVAGDRHIRVAVGRDYSDVPPTRGIFKGSAESELSVAVEVSQIEDLPDDLLPQTTFWQPADEPYQVQQQQQQQ